ncbi:EamA family transporter [Phyllobacterium myrsinacearum]|uniref:Multidrug transporter EmrE-like cation transporter n=1 Tax=Phyllobacterium myrsinacearum TaxID=28101 RepID=A0A839EXP5_9HYPH|nr:EamA family transporter [Phyllobacterium myrsinacearum]MBA8881270.1 multidrug transporter EmrE-like cation transporter [Phyllobacterium myrsinacearum]
MKPINLVWFAIPVLNTLFQVFIKLAAEQMTGLGFDVAWLVHAVTSPWMLAAIAAEVVCFVFWLQALAQLDLSKAFPLTGISYVMILATSWLVFREDITALQIIGSTLILIGVWLIGTASGAQKDSEPSLSSVIPHNLH